MDGGNTDGTGNGSLRAHRYYDRLAGKYSSGSPPDYDCHLHAGIYDLLRHRGRHFCTDKPFFGQGDLVNVRRTTAAGFHLILVLALTASVLFLSSQNFIGYLFTTSPEVTHLVSTLIIILVAYQFGDALQITYANSLRGIGDVVSMAVISFVGYLLIALPVCYLCGFILKGGITGIWIGYPIGLTLTGALLCIRYYRRTRNGAPLR